MGMGMGIWQIRERKSQTKRKNEKKSKKIAHKIDDKPFQIIFSSLTLGLGRGNGRWKLLGTRLLRGIPNSWVRDFGRGNALKSEGRMMNYLLPLSLGVKVSPWLRGRWDGFGSFWMSKNIKMNAQPKQAFHGRWSP